MRPSRPPSTSVLIRAAALAQVVGLVVGVGLGMPASADAAVAPDPQGGGGPVLAARSRSVEGRPGRWAWPLAPDPRLVERFAPPPHPRSAGHRGVDLDAIVGQPVRAPEAGVVTFSGVIAGRGVVVLAHPGGLRSTFEPVEGALPTGAAVGRGHVVATVSATIGHCAPATCLHWGVLRGETYLNPLGLVGVLRVVLLPMA
ncbi:M23 family metallopeptidase [Lapillicoccus sp.]|uniref:M23 family metallopeptidase n=1 Tax=Lapillicoccus sp. TaxID=1909287 RepID=UPI00398317CD